MFLIHIFLLFPKLSCFFLFSIIISIDFFIKSFDWFIRFLYCIKLDLFVLYIVNGETDLGLGIIILSFGVLTELEVSGVEFGVDSK